MKRQASHTRPASSGSNGKPVAGAAVLDAPSAVESSIRADEELQREIFRLVEASRAGALSDRARTDRFEGSNRKVLEGVNEMLDAILLPIGEGNRILAQISAGKIDELIVQTYQGDHEKMKLAVNNVALVLQGLQKEVGCLTGASRQGQLSERGNSAQFHGA